MSRAKQPTWPEVYDLWKSFNVPPVEIVPFPQNELYYSSPWIYKKSPSTRYMAENPEVDTAAVLCRKTVEKFGPEALAAFKLLAYLKQYDFRYEDLFGVVIQALRSLMDDPNLYAGDFWNSNARHVLPHADGDHNYYHDPKTWQDAVTKAAQTWCAIAQQRMIMRIPPFMDRDSEEHITYMKLCEAEAVRRDLEKLAYLKRRYESETT